MRGALHLGWIIYLAIAVAAIAGLWKAFEKAGAPGWAAIIPFFNVYVMTKMADKPGWWVLLVLVPVVNIIIIVIICMAIAPKLARRKGLASAWHCSPSSSGRSWALVTPNGTRHRSRFSGTRHQSVLLEHVHGFAAVPRGGYLVFVLSVRDGEA